MKAVQEIEEAYEFFKNDPDFINELDSLLKTMQADPRFCTMPKNDPKPRWCQNLSKT